MSHSATDPSKWRQRRSERGGGQPGADGLDAEIDGLLSTIESDAGVAPADARPRTGRTPRIRRSWTRGAAAHRLRKVLVLGAAFASSAAVAIAVAYAIAYVLSG